MQTQIITVIAALTLVILAVWVAVRPVLKTRKNEQLQGTPAKVPRRLWVYAILAVILLLLPFWSGPRPWQAHFSGTATEMGKHMGHKFSMHMKLLLRLYLKGVICKGEQQMFDRYSRESMQIFKRLLSHAR